MFCLYLNVISFNSLRNHYGHEKLLRFKNDDFMYAKYIHNNLFGKNVCDSYYNSKIKITVESLTAKQEIAHNIYCKKIKHYESFTL